MMKKITNPTSEIELDFRVARAVAATAALAVSLGALLPRIAHAQTYVGNAYTTKVNLSTFLDVSLSFLDTSTTSVGANVSLFDTGLLNGSEQNKIGLQGGAITDLSLATSGLLGGIGLGNIVDATVGTTQTDSRTSSIPAGLAVQSTARVTGLNLGSSTNVTNILLSNSLVKATAVQSLTTASLTGTKVGTTTLAGFSLNGLTAAQLGVTGIIDGSGNLVVTNQQVIKIYDSFLLGGIGQGTQIGTLTINELLPDSIAQGALTTNALHLKLDSNLGLLDSVLGDLAGADVIVSSSTAGFTPAAPEPGSLALLAASILPILGMAVRQRR